jgi:hypothetical protein
MASEDKSCVRITYKNNHYLVPVEFILRVHPGGQRLILPYVNQDITRAFVEAKHSDGAIQLLEQWMEGGVVSSNASAFGGVETGDSESLAMRWRKQFAAWSGADVVTARTTSVLWNTFVFGVAGATTMAAVLCRH